MHTHILWIYLEIEIIQTYAHYKHFPENLCQTVRSNKSTRGKQRPWSLQSSSENINIYVFEEQEV